MTLQEMINYEKRDSYEDGLTQGMEQGLLKGTILTCKSLNMSWAKTQATLIEQYALTSDKADEYIALYW